MFSEAAKDSSPPVRALGLLFGIVVILATLVPVPVYFLVFVIPTGEFNGDIFAPYEHWESSSVKNIPDPPNASQSPLTAGEVADFEDWESSPMRNVPAPPNASRSLLTAEEVFVYVDPWLAGVIYPLWAVLGVAVGGSIIIIAFAVLAPQGNTEGTGGLRRKHYLLACMVFVACSAVPFVIAYVIVAVWYVRMFGGS